MTFAASCWNAVNALSPDPLIDRQPPEIPEGLSHF